MSRGAEEIREAIVGQLSAWYGLAADDIADDRPLADLGVTSRDAVALAALLSELTGTRLSTTQLWETPTMGALLRHLDQDAPGHEDTPRIPDRPGAPPLDGSSPVAVVGIGCRLPGGVTSPDDFWQLLGDGRDTIGTVPGARWAPFVAHTAGLPDDINRHGSFLDDIAGFDAEHFGIGAPEATAMDPQQRMLLEVAREALDHAAIPVPSLAGTRTGVFVGISGNEYARLTTAEPGSVDAWTPAGSALSIAAGRLSYLLDLRGPSMAVDTACSSSLVAVHQAVRSLTTGECDTVLAAGVNLLLSPAVTLAFQRAGALAPDGRCKAFDRTADGMVRGEGCGVVVLKRLADAERDGDRVLAVIRSSAVNSDGRSGGLTAPNAEAQRALLEQAHTAPATVDYVEAHGTGTALGDPIEAGALGAVLGAGRGRAPDQPLLIGSAKTNLGHLEAAAGITGFIKAVLALHHDEIPPQLHFTGPGPHADLDALGLRVVTAHEPWPRYSGTATAGVSSFGFGGTNAHVVLTEHRDATRSEAVMDGSDRTGGTDRTGPAGPADVSDRADRADRTERPTVVLFDGLSEERTRAYAGELATWLDSPRSASVRPADLARTLAGRTGRGRHRVAVVARGLAETTTALTRYAAGDPDPRLITGGRTPVGPGPVWVFSGYGSQWSGMGSRLLATEPVFAAAVNRLEPVLREQAGISLRDSLRPDADLSSPAVVMPALYGIQVALAELWRSYGVEPAAVIGHSLGEIAAAVVSGALDPATGAHIVAVRSRLFAGLTGGAMAVVDRPADHITALTRDFPTIEIAVHASPTQSVVTGSAADVEGLMARVTRDGGFARSLPVTGAGHSPAVDPLLQEFAWELGSVRHAAPGCRRYSTVLDDPRDPAGCDTDYWLANLRRPVRFTQAVRAAAEDGHRVFVEVSPHSTQLHPLTETLREAGVKDPLVLPTLRRATDDALAFRSSLAALLVHGVPVPIEHGTLHPGGRVVDVPPPRWRHRRFWAGETPSAAPAPLRRATGGASTLDRLRVCVAAVMGYGEDRIDPDTPLTDFGLDSLMAARIGTAVEQQFSTRIKPGVLLRQGTLRGVAALLPEPADASGPPALSGAPRPSGPPARSASGGSFGSLGTPGTPGRLRTFPGKGPGTPLFLAHAAGGSSDVYGRLAERLDGHRPILGLDRLSDPGDPVDVTDRAAEFAHRIREVRPRGPWLVGGWSYGGLMAQETARLLSAHGTVAALVLLDTVLPLPLPGGTAPGDRARLHFGGFAAYVERTYGSPLRLPYDELAELPDAEQIDLVVKLLEQAVQLPTAVLEHQRTSYLDLRSSERHTPGPYGGRTLLYRASEPAPHTVRDTRYERDDAALGWDAHCDDLTVTPLPGHHLSLLDPPVVDTLAELLVRDLPNV